jgi:lysophospholipase L1-like esterase
MTAYRWELVEIEYVVCLSSFAAHTHTHIYLLGPHFRFLTQSLQCRQLLYRIEDGELPDHLNPKVFWILIGTNDLGADKCSAETVAAGSIRVVEELQKRRPKAQIILNSMLPRGAELGEDMSSSKQWHEVQKVNQWLECYASSTEGVEFFNATPHFVVSYDQTVHQVEAYFQDSVHPSAKGSKSWAKAIVKRLEELIPLD